MWISIIRSMYSASVGHGNVGMASPSATRPWSSAQEVGGLGERVYVIGQATGDDREKIVEGIDAFVLSGQRSEDHAVLMGGIDPPNAISFVEDLEPLARSHGSRGPRAGPIRLSHRS
jgi:hypothetical protein